MAQRNFSPLAQKEFNIAEGNYGSDRKPVDLIVVHTTVGSARSAMQRFGAVGTKVSAHYIVGLDGTIYGGLEEFLVAFHAGDYAVNQRSIAIEHEDGGNYNSPRPDTLYTSSSELVADICRYFNLSCDTDHIKRHKDFYNTACPDSLDVDRIIVQAQNILNPSIDYRKKYEEARSVLYGPGTSWSKYITLKTIITK